MLLSQNGRRRRRGMPRLESTGGGRSRSTATKSQLLPHSLFSKSQLHHQGQHWLQISPFLPCFREAKWSAHHQTTSQQGGLRIPEVCQYWWDSQEVACWKELVNNHHLDHLYTQKKLDRQVIVSQANELKALNLLESRTKQLSNCLDN